MALINEIVKATWGVVLEARKKKKYPSKTTIAWYLGVAYCGRF